MLWRPGYETRVLRGVALPPLWGVYPDGSEGSAPFEGAMLGAFGALAFAEIGVWRRLLEEAYPEKPVPTVLVRPVWTARERRVVADATPPSHHAQTLLADDPGGAWALAVGSERAFGAVMRGGVATLLMTGLPTEEAWDLFREALGA